MPDPQAQFEARLQAAMQPGRMDAAFAARLRGQLAAAARRPQPARRPRLSRRAWASLLVVLALAVALRAIGPQRVLAQVLGWLGYVPGVGFVESESGLRILEEPQMQEREGITITVLDGLVDDTHTVLTIQFEGIRQEQKPNNEAVPGCWQQPLLRLADGSQLQTSSGGGGGGPSWMRLQLIYPAFPSDENEIVLEVPCVPEVMPGLGPENWQIPLRFVPAPEGFQVLPVQLLPQPTDEPPAPHGFLLSIEDYVELEDGYLLRGRFSWDPSVYPQPDFWLLDLALFDAQGQRIPAESTYPASVEEQPYITWTLQTNTKQISSPARVALEDISIRTLLEYGPDSAFELDLGSGPQSGQVWNVDQTLQLGGHTVRVGQVKFEARLDGTYALLSNIDFNPSEITTLNLMDLDNHSQMLWWSGAGVREGQIEIGIGYDYLPTGVHRFWVDNYFERLQGPWTSEISLPEPSGDPLPPEACLTPENWQLATTQLPSALGGSLLVQDFSMGGMLPSLYLVPIHGGQRQNIDTGSWPALSADGRQVAYARDGLRIFDIETGQTRTLIQEDSSYAITWSPDDAQLAFVRGGQGVYVINADGTGLRPVPGNNSDVVGLAGWLPDGEHVVVSRILPEGSQQQTMNVITGALSNNLLIDNRKGGFVKLAPDGRQVTYGEQIFGGFNYSLFLATLDDPNPRLLAESSAEVMFSAGAWLGPQWLAVNVYEPATSAYKPPLLLNVVTCESYLLALPGIQIMGWSP